MKIFKTLSAVSAAAALLVSAGVGMGVAQAATGRCAVLDDPIFEAVNPKLGISLLSRWSKEIASAKSRGFTTNTGVAFYGSTTPAAGLVAVHRLYHSKKQDFLYSASATERKSAVSKHGYVDQGISFYVSPVADKASGCGDSALRMVKGGLHRVAARTSDRASLTKAGWRAEATNFYVARKVVKAAIPAQPFVIGTSKPNVANTGPRKSLVAHAGNIRITTPGAVLSGKDVAGFVRISANNVTVRDNRIKGRGTAYVQSALVQVDPGVTGTKIEYNDIGQAATVGYWQNGVSGSNYTARFNDVHDVVDHFTVDAGGAVIEANYLHHFSFHSNDKDHAKDRNNPYWTHNDGVQVKGGSKRTVIRGNYFATSASTTTGTKDAPAQRWGAGITVSPDKSAVSNLLVTLNWQNGGDVGFQANGFHAGASSAALGEVSHNRFGVKHYYYAMRYKRGNTVTAATTNVWDRADLSVPAGIRGASITTAKGGLQIDS